MSLKLSLTSIISASFPNFTCNQVVWLILSAVLAEGLNKASSQTA
jgi:hypothetical protein